MSTGTRDASGAGRTGRKAPVGIETCWAIVACVKLCKGGLGRQVADSVSVVVVVVGVVGMWAGGAFARPHTHNPGLRLPVGWL